MNHGDLTGTNWDLTGNTWFLARADWLAQSHADSNSKILAPIKKNLSKNLICSIAHGCLQSAPSLVDVARKNFVQRKKKNKLLDVSSVSIWWACVHI
jgi:hypothetical protein